MGIVKRVGFLVNPLAGIGGRVGLKGSDGLDIVRRAMSLGAVSEAFTRSGQALELLKGLENRVLFLTGEGDLGAGLLSKNNFNFQTVYTGASYPTTAKDTIKAISNMLEAGIDLLLFAGGDGTARDIWHVVGGSVPVIGIPAGVKMHSAVFAINPRNAGAAVMEYLQSGSALQTNAEVMDIDEELFRKGIVEAKLYGYMKIPELSGRMQSKKSGTITIPGELRSLASYVTDQMENGILYLVGPGSTTESVMDELGLPNTLLGVDAVQDKQLIASDINEEQILNLMKNRRAKIILTPIGGQGVLLGRGNQQFSPRILHGCKSEDLIVVATVSKLLSLRGRPLIIDTGDAALVQEWKGYVEVITGYRQCTIYPVMG